MNPAQLIKMANQIGAFFEATPDQEQAAHEIAQHILRNWPLRMRTELLTHVVDTGDGELKPAVRDALALIR